MVRQSVPYRTIRELLDGLLSGRGQHRLSPVLVPLAAVWPREFVGWNFQMAY